MGSDAPEGRDEDLQSGNQVTLSLSPDSREETTRLFRGLAEGGEVTMDLQDTFWNAYYGSLTDRFGVNWMVNYEAEG